MVKFPVRTVKHMKCRTFSLFNFPYFTPSQIPICIVSKGAVPRTRKKKLTMVQSCNFTLINPSDYSRRMQKNAYPLVVCYNGRDHYVPTKPTTYHAYYKWKTEKELAPILSAGLIVIEEMDLQFLSDEQKQACNEIEACIVKHLPTLSQKVTAAHHAMVARAPGHGARGPVFEIPTGTVSSAPGKFDLPSSFPPLLPQCPHISPVLENILLLLPQKRKAVHMSAIYVTRSSQGSQPSQGICGSVIK